MLEIPQIGEFYKHYKGNVYRIIPCPKYASTGAKISSFDSNGAIVWYQDIKTQQVWRRTLKDFLEPKVLDDSTVVKRFELVENGADLISDGYHSFGELYEHRNILYLIFLYYCKAESSWRATKHHDGTGHDGWFIAGCYLFDRQISYHLPMNLWDYCSFLKTYEMAPVAWDGHTSQDVLQILKDYLPPVSK